MFAKLIRAAPMAAGAGLIGAILSWILPTLVAAMTVTAAEDNMVVQSFQAIGEHSLTVMLLSVFVGLLAGAAREARVGV